MNYKPSKRETYDLIWRYFKGTPYEDIRKECSNVNPDDLHSIVLGSKGIRLRERLFKIWQDRDKEYKDGMTLGEYFEKLLKKKGEKK